MTISQAESIISIVGVIVAALTFSKAVLEYQRQGAQKRADAYFNIERLLLSEKAFQEINELLLADGDSKSLAIIPLSTRLEYLGLYEEVALMLNSKMINEHVAHYMFGYLAIKCYESNHFWVGEDKNDKYWDLLRDFVGRMKLVDEKFVFNRRNLRF